MWFSEGHLSSSSTHFFQNGKTSLSYPSLFTLRLKICRKPSSLVSLSVIVPSPRFYVFLISSVFSNFLFQPSDMQLKSGTSYIIKYIMYDITQPTKSSLRLNNEQATCVATAAFWLLGNLFRLSSHIRCGTRFTSGSAPVI